MIEVSVEKYVRSIDGSDVLLEKVNKVKNLADTICPEKVDDLFISEYRRSNGERIIESLYFFSERHLMESKNLMSAEIRLDILFYYGYIDYFEITAKDYDFSKASENSTLKVEGYVGNAAFVFNATGGNCDKLWEIVNTYIKPNLYSEYEFEEEELEEELA